MENVVKASDNLSRSTDTSANKTLSGLRAWERYQFVTDNVYRSVQKADQAIKTLSTAFEQKRMSAQRYREELEKVWRGLEQAGIPRNFQAGDFEKVRQQAMETVRFREMERDISMQVAAFDKTRLQERATLQRRANELLEMAMPLEQARIRFGKEQVEINKMRAQGIIDEAQKVALLADAQRRLNVIQTAHARTGGRFSRAELTNVSYQLNDVVTMLASGSNFSQVLATQGPQLFQIVQGAGGEGGLVAGFKNLGAAIGALISPTTVAVTTLVTGAGAAIAAWASFDSSIRNVERSLMGLGRSTPATAQQLSAIAENAAEAAGMSRREARSGVAAMAGTGRIDPRLMGEALEVGKDLAIMTGQDLPEAMADLAKSLADPGKGVKDLDDRFNLFNATQLRTIERMAASGDRFGAAKAIIDALNDSIGKASETTSGWARIWEQVARIGSNMFDALGEDIDEVFNGTTDARLLDRLQRSRQQAMTRRDQIAGDSLMDEYNRSASVKEYENIIKRYDEQIAQLERRLTLGPMANPMDATINNLSKDLNKLTEDFDPVQREIEETTDKLKALYRIFDDPNSINLDQNRLSSGIDFQTRRLAQQQAAAPYGGRQQWQMVRDSQFGAATSAGLTEYARSVAELDKRYADLNREAEYNIQNTEQLNRVLEANTEARRNEREALDRRTAESMARRVAPELFERGDLQNQVEELEKLREKLIAMGMSAEQADEAIGRAQTALQNYRTWTERLKEDYELQQREIAAVTFEQKAAVEAERARIEALRAGRNELEASAAAEAARNNALARSQRMGWEELRDQRDQAATLGMKPFQREQAEIGQRYERLRTEEGDSAYLRDAEALERWRAAQEAIRGPLEESNEELNEQIRLTQVQAETYGGLVGAVEEAAERQRLLNEYMRAGVEITPELSAAIDEYARRAGQLKQVQYSIREQQQTFEDIKDMGKDALKGFISDLKAGKSAGEAFLNVLEKILDRILDMMLNSLFDPNSQKGFNIFSALFGGGKSSAASSLPSLISSNPFSAAPNLTAAPAQAYSPMPPLQLNGYGSPKINEAISGAVPTFKAMTTEVANTFTKSMSTGLGNFFTKASDGIRYQVEAYVRQGALDRGMDPDIIARGIKQESGFNPFAQNINAKEASYGVFQLNTKGGLGAVAQQRGISLDPSNWKEQADFSLDIMQKQGTGQWYGFRDVGIRDPFAAHKAFQNNLTGGSGTNDLRGGLGLDNLSTQVDTASNSFTNLNPSLDQFGSSFSGITDTMKQGVPQLQQSFNSVPSMIGQGGEGVGTALDNTAGIIGQGSQGIGGALNQLGQALSGMGGGGGGGGFGGLGGLFGGMFGGGGMWGGWMSNVGSWTLPTDFSMSFFHEGGRVGAGGRQRRMSFADALAFIGAPSFHSGTRGALRSDERRAILQTDEEVLSRKEAADYRAGKARGGKGDPMVVQPVVNVINPPSEPQTRTNPDGSVDVIFEQIEGRMAERAKRGRGPLVRAIGSRREGNALIG